MNLKKVVVYLPLSFLMALLCFVFSGHSQNAVSIAMKSGTKPEIVKKSETSKTSIYGAYHNAIGRYNDFAMENGDNSSGEEKLVVTEVTAKSDDGNVPSNTLDEDLETRWSAFGEGQYITYDLGASKKVSSIQIAWYKGDSRSAKFKVRVGNSTSSLTTIYNGNSSGNTRQLETYYFQDVTARYVRITCFGNTSNQWNSITETEIYGSEGTDPGSSGVDLSVWKLTLPMDRDGGYDNPYPALEVFNPQLSDYDMPFPSESEQYFYKNGDNWVFDCTYTGVRTSSGTKYSRSELREMKKNSAQEKNWTLGEGGTMEGTFKVTELENASKLFVMQIHGKSPSDKVLLKVIWESGQIRLLRKIKQGDEWIDNEKKSSYADLPLNTEVTIKIVADTSALTIYINGNQVEQFTDHLLDDWGADNTFYFKAGNYLQHNTSLFGHRAAVEYSSLKVSHGE